MVKFAYTALDAKGKESKGTIEADSQNAALAKLREQGLFPTQVSDTSAAARGRKGGLPVPGTAGRAARAKSRGKPLKLPFGGGVKTKQLMIVTRQLATLIDAGLPLLRSLQVIARQERNSTLKRTLNDLAESIQSGSTLAEAILTRRPELKRDRSALEAAVVDALLGLLAFTALTAFTYYRLNRTDYDYSREGTERHKVDTAAYLMERNMEHEQELKRMALDAYLRQIEGRNR